MSEMKHTPGPWHVLNRGKHYNNPNIDWLEIAWSDDGELVTELVYGEANARLIAAAPDLLEALKRCSKLIEGEVPAFVIDAIAKANGHTKQGGWVQSECGTCYPDGVYDTNGNGPFDCYACGKKADTASDAACTLALISTCDNCGRKDGCCCLMAGIGSGPYSCPTCQQPVRDANIKHAKAQGHAHD